MPSGVGLPVRVILAQTWVARGPSRRCAGAGTRGPWQCSLGSLWPSAWCCSSAQSCGSSEVDEGAKELRCSLRMRRALEGDTVVCCYASRATRLFFGALRAEVAAGESAKRLSSPDLFTEAREECMGALHARRAQESAAAPS
ncbi:hypothetical protein NDU88_006195 [Pleurodeles waltl]|uniref:Uncharacterized protein n=1 Tax=Pleurodeles waltl TaxID=8319 RepID=A0AAV7WE39_PLEWA|nr:hypothetical protein NDU88_006195 [Pleurodeles waltl]